MRSLLLAAAVAAASAAAPKKYNTNARRVDNPGVLNVHIVPHTHDDVGWLKTVDQYYYGAQNSIQHANVASIISATVAELAKNPDRKFSYVEQAFFQRWWSEQDAETQALVRQLVASGQLEFVNGGWCMHDESSPTFVDMIDQTALGHRLIMQEFGVAPRATWQIDPFGHSGFQASMMSAPISGFTSVFFARSDYQDFANRKSLNATEFFWYPSPSQGTNAATLGGIFPYYYYPASGLNYGGDDGCEPVMDDPTLEDYNVPEQVDNLVAQAQQAASWTLGNDVMLLEGTDFSYENAVTWYRSLDKLIHYANLDGRVNAFYSTPSAYAAARITTSKLPRRTDDMFPYADGPHAVWAGYFTSRSALKAYIRESSSYHQAARQLQLLSGKVPADTGETNPLYLLERAMGVNQHHDAVSGTSKQAVAYDYALRIAAGRIVADGLVSTSIAALTGATTQGFATCDLTNVTICPALESGQAAIVVIYNQQAQTKFSWPVRVSVGLPSGVASYTVTDYNNAAVTAQMVPLSAQDTHLRSEYYNYTSTTPVSWLAFTANVPAMGYATYFLQPSATVEGAPHTHMSQVQQMRTGAHLRAGDQTVTNGIVTLTVSAATGLLNGFSNARNGVNAPLSSTFAWYNSSTGVPNSPEDGDQASGAYIFRPNGTSTFPVTAGAVTVSIVTGPVVQEVRQTYDAAWASQVIRLWANATTVDFEFTIGPIPFADGLGKEIVSVYTVPGMATQGAWVTDSNCRDSMARKRNYRPSWTLNVTEPVADNYFPVNCLIYTKDAASGLTLSVVTDRSHGGSSQTDGSVELMVHRRLQHDDSRGVGEPLNETGLDGNGLIVRGVHKLSLEPAATAGATRRALVQEQLLRPLTTYSNLPGTPAAWIAANKASFTGVQAPLPANVHILTAQALGGGKMLLRVSHNFESGEDAVLSANATVNLASIFSGITITSATEMTLTGNQPLTAVEPVTYNTDDGASYTLPVIPPPPAGPQLSITISPMEIRTFLCTFQ